MGDRRLLIAFIAVVIACVVVLSIIHPKEAPAESVFVVQRYDIEDLVYSGDSFLEYKFCGVVGDKLVFSWNYYRQSYNFYIGFSGVGSGFTLDGEPFILTDYDAELGNWIELGYWTEGT